MLKTLRKKAAHVFTMLLFGVLIIAFAAWGVGDIFRGYDREELASVGGRQISRNDFERAYQNQLAAVSHQIGRPLTTAEARTFGLTQRVLQTLVGSTAMSIHAEKLGLGIGEQTVVDDIRNQPAFQGPNGKFDRKVFDAVLRENGFSEQRFVSLQRQDLLRAQITEPLTSGVTIPQTLIEAFNHAQNDQRVLKYFTLPATAAGTVQPPSDEALNAYYEEHKTSFKAPEYRKIAMILVTTGTLKDALAIPDADIKAYYEAEKKKYAVPELRTIQQLIFKDKAAAEEASRKLASGADFIKLGQELGMKESDINLGTFAKDKLADRKIAEAAFSLEKDKPSGVIDGFSPVIIRVTEIKPGSQKSLDEVKDQIRDTLVKSRANQAIGKIYDTVEDARGGGKTLGEIAQQEHLKYEELVFDHQGKGEDGKPVEAIAKLPQVLKLAFDSDVGVENNPVTLPEGYAFVDVREVIPERQKPLSEVKDEVKSAWMEDETRSRMDKKARELIAGAKPDDTIEKLAQAVGAKVTQTAPLKRTDAQPGLTLTAVAEAFARPEKTFVSTQTADRKSRVIFQVIEVKPAPAPDEKQTEALRAEIRRGMSSDILAQYVNGLENAYGVTVNPKALSALTGQQ